MTSREVGTFYEFFAGGGMARTGLGERWRCVFANEFSGKKAEAYRMNFGPSPELRVEDVAKLTVADLPEPVDLAWASFPCQDLSLAGNGQGLEGARSGAFWPFWRLISDLGQDRPVPIVVLENVVGAITSNDGEDFRALLDALASGGYRFGPMVVDAARFVPQSRPRLFVIALHAQAPLPPGLTLPHPDRAWHPSNLQAAYKRQPSSVQDSWIWWNVPTPPRMSLTITDVVEDAPVGVEWHSPAETARLLAMMSEVNLAKVEKAKAYGKRIAGTIYKRVRTDSSGVKTQRAEVRFDQIGGCLRTPAGGSSRQIIILVEKDSVRTRLLSPREAARLMGVPKSYCLPGRYNDAYHVLGDGLVVPVVSWLERTLLRPLALEGRSVSTSAA